MQPTVRLERQVVRVPATSFDIVAPELWGSRNVSRVTHEV